MDLCRSGCVRRGDGYLLTGSLVHGDLRTGSSLELYAVGQISLHETSQRNAVQIDHIEEGVLGNSHDEGDGIGLRCATLRRHGDGLNLAVQYAQYALRSLSLVKSDSRDLAHTFRQGNGIIQLIGSKALKRRASHIDHGEVHIAGSSHREMDDIRTAGTALRTNGDLIIACETADCTNRSRLEISVHKCVSHLRQYSCSLRQVHPILVRLRIEAIDELSVEIDSLERVLAEGLHGECDEVDTRASVTGSYRNTGLTVQTGRRDCYLLELITRDGYDLRQYRSTYRQIVRIVISVRVEAFKRYATDRNAVQRRVIGLLRGEHQFIN